MKCHIEAPVVEQREFALNGNPEQWMEEVFLARLTFYGNPLELMLATLLRMRCTKMMRT
jgi:hypothetical protein